MSGFRGSCRILGCAIACFLVAATTFKAPGQAPAAAPRATITPAAGEELGKGLDALKNQRDDEAIAHFQRAVELDPNSILARFYLGSALSQKVVPGVRTPENLKTAQQAIDAFKQVVEKAPQHINPMEQIAAIYLEIDRPDEARTWQMKVLNEDPRDAEAACTIGAIDWIEARRNALAALKRAGIDDDGQGNAKAPAAVMKIIAAQNGPLLEEGVEYLIKAIQLRPNYDDAMQYLSLIYRRKADLDRSDAQARQDDVDMAEDWTQKAAAVRHSREAHGDYDSGGGGGDDLAFDLLFPPPPPPPPPVEEPKGSENAGVAGGSSGAGSIPEAAPPSSSEETQCRPEKVHISAGVAEGFLLKKHPPAYPPIAKAARVSGTVVLDATISKTGAVENLRVLSGHPLLQQAALDAVKTWRYKPYLLNGHPITVETTVNVIFTLDTAGSGHHEARDDGSGSGEQNAGPFDPESALRTMRQAAWSLNHHWDKDTAWYETIATAAARRPYWVGDVTIVLRPPGSGMTEVGDDNRAKLAGLVPEDNWLIAAYLSAEDLSELKSGETPIPSDYALVEAIRAAETTEMSADDFKSAIDAMGQQMGFTLNLPVTETGEQFKQRIDAMNLDDKVDSRQQVPLGVLFCKTDACGFGVIRAGEKNDDGPGMVVSVIVLRVRKRILLAYVYSSYGGEISTEYVRGLSEWWADRILADNP